MSPEYLNAKIANTSLRLPVYKDRETTLKIAEKVTDRVRQQEDTASRIDTQAFALLTAFDLATELDELQERHATEERELILALEKLASKLSKMTDTE